MISAALIVSVIILGSTVIKADEAINLAKAESYDDALIILSKQKAPDAEHLFWRATCYYKLRKIKEATADCEALADSFNDVPIRYVNLSLLMIDEMKAWAHDEDKLGDISRRMGEVTSRLKNMKAGPETQAKQKKLVKELDDLIADAEAKANAAKGLDKDGNPLPLKPKDGQQNNSDNTQPTDPATDSVPLGGSGPGQIDRKRLKETAAVWGKLSEKERAKAIQNLSKDLPARYREIIEKYFKAINKGKS